MVHRVEGPPGLRDDLILSFDLRKIGRTGEYELFDYRPGSLLFGEHFWHGEAFLGVPTSSQTKTLKGKRT